MEMVEAMQLYAGCGRGSGIETVEIERIDPEVEYEKIVVSLKRIASEVWQVGTGLHRVAQSMEWVQEDIHGNFFYSDEFYKLTKEKTGLSKSSINNFVAVACSMSLEQVNTLQQHGTNVTAVYRLASGGKKTRVARKNAIREAVAVVEEEKTPLTIAQATELVEGHREIQDPTYASTHRQSRQFAGAGTSLIPTSEEVILPVCQDISNNKITAVLEILAKWEAEYEAETVRGKAIRRVSKEIREVLKNDEKE